MTFSYTRSLSQILLCLLNCTCDIFTYYFLSIAFKWTDDNVRLLIHSYLQLKDSIGQSTKKDFFEKVAKEFNSCTSENNKVQGFQCQRKWAKLEAKHKEIIDHNRQTGRSRMTWKFMDEMENILAVDNPKINKPRIHI